jgi:hypothetical protein
VFGEKPEGVKTQEGIEVLAGLNRLSVASNRWLDESPEGERRNLVPLRQLIGRRTMKTTRGQDLVMN